MYKLQLILVLSFAICDIVNAQSQRTQILDKIRTGATQFQNDPAVRNSAPVVVEVVNENGRRSQRVTPRVWTDENIDILEFALSDELQRKNVQLRPNKQNDILNHLERYAAHKAVLFSTLQPSEELAEVMAAQLVRGIEWANSPEITYPSAPARVQAKVQINLILDVVQAELINQVSTTISANQEINRVMFDIRKKYDWMTDSPFYVHGKKVLYPYQVTQITNDCLDIAKTEFDPNEIQLQPSARIRGASEPKENISSYLWGYTHKATRPLIREYYKGMNREPSKEDVERDKALIDQLRSRFKR